MNNLNELNTYGGREVDIQDQRLATVIFDRQYPLTPIDQVYSISATVVTVYPGINIREIIQYETANVRYRIKIVTGGSPLLTGSALSWSGSFPTGVTLNQVGDTYTISGLKSESDWEEVKQFQWNLPLNYASCPLWFLEVSILYYDEALDEEKSVSWYVYDDTYFYVGQFTSTSSMTVNGQDCRLMAANLVEDSSAMVVAGYQYEGIILTLPVTASLVAEGQVSPINISSTTSLNITAKAFKNASSSLSSSNSMSVSGIIAVSNMMSRNFTANTANNIFATDTPVIEDINPLTASTFTIQFSSPDGAFSTSESEVAISPWSYTGTLNQVNAKFSQIKFYPNKNFSSGTTMSYTQYKDSISQFSRTVNLSGNAGTYSPQIVTITSSQSWTPTNTQFIYGGYADVLLVGGGGGGGGIGGGGGGGGVQEIFNVTLSQTAYSLVVGSGGLGNSVSNGGNGGTLDGGNGTSTSGFGTTVNGGTGGKGYYHLDNYPADYPTQPTVYRWNHSGGASGNPTSHNGGAFTGVAFSYNYALWNGGAGGGGAGAVGGAGSEGLGGAGVVSTITGSTYGRGGDGALNGGANGSANTGNGGEGWESSTYHGDGGSGVIVIKIHA